MALKTTGARHRLGEPVSSNLAAFCEANLGTAEIKVIREAVQFYIDYRTSREPELRDRYEAAKKRMMGATAGDNVVVLPKQK